LKQLPDPALWNLPTEDLRIQIWTEMLECPVPATRISYLRRETDPTKRRAMATPDFTDAWLSFGSCTIGRGKAFSIENDAIAQAGANVQRAAAVGKELATVENRVFLVESVLYQSLKPFLDTLPRMASVNPQTNRISRLASAFPGARTVPVRSAPEAKNALESEKSSELLAAADGDRPRSEAEPRSNAAAPADGRAPGLARSRRELVAAFRKPANARLAGSALQLAEKTQQPRYTNAVNIDYETRIGSTNAYTFKADETTYISGQFTPATALFEGGTVLKFAPTNSASIYYAGNATFTFAGTNYRPVVITGRDDDTVGTAIDGSTGLPAVHYYASPAFEVYSGKPFSWLRISYAYVGIYFDTDGDPASTVRHCQFVHCGSDLQTATYTEVRCDNCLFHDTGGAVFDSVYPDGNFLIRGTHLTADAADTLGWAGEAYLTNSILYAADGSLMTLHTNCVAMPGSLADFQTVGGASHYLTNSSAYIGAGTTNISPTLAAEMKLLTHYAPIVFPRKIFGNTNLILSPQAQRGESPPSLGYAYPPIDFVFGSAFFTNSSILLTNGVAIATFSPSDDGYGIALDDRATMISEGSPTSLNHIVRYNTVQEQATTNWSTAVGSSIFTTWVGNPLQRATFRFTDWSILAQDAKHVYGYPGYADFPMDFRDCQFRGGAFLTSQPTFNVTNCLFERVAVETDGYSSPASQNFRSCTFYGGSLVLDQEGGGTWTFLDNLFDKTTIGGLLTSSTNDYNGYVTNSDRIGTGPHDVILGTNNVGWQSSWLGNFYLPTNSPFIDKASFTNSALIGMYHYTTLTNQTKELTNHLDCGFHYVAVTNGIPIDTDGDGVPDYREDINGSGGPPDSGETDWLNAGDWGLRVFITRPRGGSIIP